ncbi:MAG TPA: FkbM family methyltransferase [Flavobacteriales bacterium]|nr:FkbM family methyltransferase [Flavobacteriales bacterium]
MLIEYKTIVEKYNLQIKNILHVGAHKAEEEKDYFNSGCEKVIWVEANPDLVSYLKNTLDKTRNKVLEAVVSDSDDQEVEFIITNNGQSSSILELGIHKDLFPGVYQSGSITRKTKTIKTLFNENKLSFDAIDFINLDIQGAELLALKGIGENFYNIKAILAEINTDYVYKKCALIGEIDDYLSAFNFKRVETVMWHNHPWGDALYIKKE